MIDAVRDEPVLDASQAPGAGSLVSRDLLRVAVVAVLVGACVAAPDSSPIIAPFVSVLVALRLLRAREGQRRFLVIAGTASLAIAAVVGLDLGARYLPAVVAFALLVVALGVVHARAARLDPVDHVLQQPWPEPRLDTGFGVTVVAWTVLVVVLTALTLPAIESLTAFELGVVDDAYAGYVNACGDGGALESRRDFCASILEQRDSARELVRSHAPELLAGALALLAFGAAATAHLVVLVRARRSIVRIRPGWRVRDLEVHWSAAFLVAAGAIAWTATRGAGGAGFDVVRAAAVGVGTLGGLLVVTQGFGLAAWLLTRGSAPRWYRGFLFVVALFVIPITLLALFVLGVLDMALHPRRRGADSGSVAGRGSGDRPGSPG